MYLTASAESRAKRRVLQNIEKGYEADYDAILADIIKRDYQDMHREFSPLVKADDAIEIDTTGKSINEVVQSVLSYSERHNRSVTIAYLLIPGVNDRANDVKQLGRWFRDKNVLINLLQYNETDCKAVRRPNKQELVAFRDKLNKVGLTVKIRESRGGNIKAACGQLVSRLNNRNMSAPKKKGASELDTGSSNNAGSSSRLKPSKRRYVNNKSKNGKKGSSHK